MTRHFISHLPLRRNGSVWPGDEYATFRGMGRHVSPLFPIPHTSAFSWTCCSCCCCEVHTATTRNLKPPFRYTRQGGPRLCSHRGASASAVPPSFRRDTTLPAFSYAFTIGGSESLTPGQPTDRWLSCLDYWYPTGQGQGGVTTPANTPAQGVNFIVPHIRLIARSDT